MEKPGDLENGLRTALQHKGPAVIDVLVHRQELSMPPHINMSQMAGFAMYLAKAVLNGRGDEIIDLAHTELFR